MQRLKRGEASKFVDSFCLSETRFVCHLCALEAYIRCSQVDEVHFLSDSVTNQYRNKKMFFLVKSEIAKMFGGKKIQWHYSEAGHGKGAPDGIGGCLKQSADLLVAQGKDVANFESFTFQLKDVCKGIKIFATKEENMKMYESIPDLDVFKGTLKIHQIIWIKNKENLLQASLSCLKCLPNVEYKHYGLGQIQLASAYCILSFLVTIV